MVPTRRFGRTEMQVPVVAIGGGWVGGILIHGDRETRFAQLDAAMDAGVDLIDTAALYGQGRSEEMIGEWLAARSGAARRPRIITKFSVDATAGDIAGQMRRSVEESFSRLGLDRVEAILLHNQIVPDRAGASGMPGLTAEDVLAAGGVRDAMDALVADGFCDHLGFTALGDPAEAKKLIRSGRFDIAQVYYNLLNPTAGVAAPPGWNTEDFRCILADCAAADMGVMGIRAFAGGHAAATERHGREIPVTANADNAAEEARAAAIFAALEGETGSRAQLALRFALAETRISTIVLGLGEDWHFAHALEALDMGPLGPDALARLAEVRAANPAFTS